MLFSTWCYVWSFSVKSLRVEAAYLHNKPNNISWPIGTLVGDNAQFHGHSDLYTAITCFRWQCRYSANL